MEKKRPMSNLIDGTLLDNGRSKIIKVQRKSDSSDLQRYT